MSKYDLFSLKALIDTEIYQEILEKIDNKQDK